MGVILIVFNIGLELLLWRIYEAGPLCATGGTLQVAVTLLAVALFSTDTLYPSSFLRLARCVVVSPKPATSGCVEFVPVPRTAVILALS